MKLFSLILLPVPNVVSMLGVGTYAAKKIVDAIFMGSALWQLALLMVACGASISLGLLIIKKLVQIIGRTAAINW